MMTEPGYPAARAVAARVQSHFARHLGPNAVLGDTLPDLSDIESIVDAAFWASLRREEGYVPKISIALVAPDRASQPILFDRRLSLDSIALTKVAPAVERPGIHLGVWRFNGELQAWGTTRLIPAFAFV